MRPFAGPPLPRLKQRDALRRAAACDKAARGSAEERYADRKFTLRSAATKSLWCNER